MKLVTFYCNLHPFEEQRIKFIAIEAITTLNAINEIKNFILYEINRYLLNSIEYRCTIQTYEIENIPSRNNAYIYFKVNEFYILIDL